ncbi:MAG: hypothetical protein KGO93_00310 [Cyanobacteria bacterium REEB446]|nr:hypothetical protein [Cyanobacteria bacterium REEB446]
MINQNTSVFFMHNFALKSSLAAKIEIVKRLKSEIRDYFGKINEFKSKYNPSHIRRLIRNLYRFQKNKNYSGTELAEKLWPAVENYLSGDLDINNEDRSELEKKAYLMIILDRTNKFFNFDFLPRDTQFQIYIFYSLILDYLSKLIKTLFSEDSNDLEAINSFLLNKLSYSLNLAVFLHMNPDADTGYLQDLDTEIRLFIPAKKIKIPDSLLKSLSILFEDSSEEIQEKLLNTFITTNDFISSQEFLAFDAALAYSDKLNLELENYNSEISQLKYSIKKLVINISSAKLYQIYFNKGDFLSTILQETVREMAEEAGVRFIDLDKELIKANSKAQDFYKTVNSYLVCSCSYFDTELIKRKFFNKTAYFLREALAEINPLSIVEKETIALAALSSSENGLDLLLSRCLQEDAGINFVNHLDLKELIQKPNEAELSSMSLYRHKIQFSLWQKAKLIIKRIKTINSEKQKLQNSITALELV